MPIVGTAGHVDHGKSTLVRLLTGRDPDRWELEKRRGLTIDLGFAWTTLPGGTEVGFVDVPGHDRYIRNMLAGVGGIDLALFVVAADDGWKPQSEEHLAVLDLLEVRHGVIALTKADTVDQELLDLQAADIQTELMGTTLHDAPLVATSAHGAKGIDDLARTLGSIATQATVRDIGRPRVWIDRAFTVPGAGTVVTGTLRDGSLTVGDSVVVHPGGANVRIRGLQVHEQPTENARAGTRVAVNLARVDPSRITRGAMLGLPDHWKPTSRFLALLRPARYEPTIRPKGAYQVHIGTQRLSATLRVLDRNDDGAIAVLDLAAPLTVTAADRFILRDAGRRHVVAGGQILDPDPPRRRATIMDHAATLQHAVRASPDAIADTLLALRGRDNLRRLAAHSDGGQPTSAFDAGDVHLSPTEADQLTDTIRAHVDRTETDQPNSLGIPLVDLARGLDLNPATVRALIRYTTDLTEHDGRATTVHHATRYQPEQDPRWIAARTRLETEWPAVPTVSDLDLPSDLLQALQARRHLVRISPTLAYLPDQLTRILNAIRALGQPFTVSEACANLRISRRYGIPILEWADRNGHTRRRGNLRCTTTPATPSPP